MNSTLECPDFDESGQDLLNNFSFYLEGVVQTPLAILGNKQRLLMKRMRASLTQRTLFIRKQTNGFTLKLNRKLHFSLVWVPLTKGCPENCVGNIFHWESDSPQIKWFCQLTCFPDKIDRVFESDIKFWIHRIIYANVIKPNRLESNCSVGNKMFGIWRIAPKCKNANMVFWWNIRLAASYLKSLS